MGGLLVPRSDNDGVLGRESSLKAGVLGYVGSPFLVINSYANFEYSWVSF